MSIFNEGKPYHGSKEVCDGNLKGMTGQTDYFNFICPKCPDNILRILDYVENKRVPVNEYNKFFEINANCGFTLTFKLSCEKCGLIDFVKITNTGLQSGEQSMGFVRP